MKKIFIVGALLLLLAAGTAYAYFTSYFVLPIGNLQTAVLEVSATETTAFPDEVWTPGDTKESIWLVRNSGTAPAYVKGYFTGQWDTEGLSNEVIHIAKIERKEQGAWIRVLENPTAGQEFYHSQTGAADNLLVLNPGDTAEYRFTVMLDTSADDDYQLRTFDAEVHIAARQVVAGAVWPLGY